MSKMKLTRPLIVFDLETTGLDPAEDRIIQFSIIKQFPGTAEAPQRVTRFVNPCREIPEEAIKIHGITNEQIKDAKPFKEMAEGIAKFIKNCDVVGYNSNRFDVPFLLYEFERAGIFDALDSVEFIDVFNLYCKFNPRTLSQAYADYCGKHLDGHKADADALATWEVLQAIISEHGEEITAENIQGPTVNALAQMSKRSKNIDILGVIVENDKGEAVFNLGKHKGKPIKSQRTYCNWLLTKGNFAENTKRIVKEILNTKT
jgi:DNA polymerase-3 subunit epsilon